MGVQHQAMLVKLLLGVALVISLATAAPRSAANPIKKPIKIRVGGWGSSPTPPAPMPTRTPTRAPTRAPTPSPTRVPSASSGSSPTTTDAPSTRSPTNSPTNSPTRSPTHSPTLTLSRIDWTAGFSDPSARQMPAACGSRISFEWSGAHNVYSFPSSTAFEACDFSGATLIGQQSPVMFDIDDSVTGTLYFGCSVSSHCSMGQKVALVVSSQSPTGVPTSAPSTFVPVLRFSMEMNGVSAAQFEQPAVQLSFKESVAVGGGCDASSVVIVSSSRRDLNVVFLIETYEAVGGVGEYLGSADFVQGFNQAVAAKGVTGLVLQSTEVSLDASSSPTDAPTMAGTAQSDEGASDGSLVIIIVAVSVGIVVVAAVACALIMYCRSRQQVASDNYQTKRVDFGEPQVVLNVISAVGVLPTSGKIVHSSQAHPNRQPRRTDQKERPAAPKSKARKCKLRGPPPPYQA